MATGLACHANRPREYRGLAAGLVSHSCDDNDFDRLRGARVVVIGGGQSAIEYAALLHEAGVSVHVVSRRPVVWLSPDTGKRRSLVERLLAPDASIAPGWKTWALERAPYLFYRFPQRRKDIANRNYYISAASDWLRARVIGKITLHEGYTIVNMEPSGRAVDVTFSDGQTWRADRVMLATGYRVDFDDVKIVHPSIRMAVETDQGVPVLSAWFESTVPGLYFVGLTSLRAFGPLYRFVAGCDATAQRVTSSIVRARHGLRGPTSGTGGR
jgi:thioredoxin reductase